MIDNEWFGIEAAGFDLGRTFSRWPLSEPEWDRFLRAYETAAQVRLGPLDFWQIALGLLGLRLRLQAGRDPSLALAVLRRLAAR